MSTAPPPYPGGEGDDSRYYLWLVLRCCECGIELRGIQTLEIEDRQTGTKTAVYRGRAPWRGDVMTCVGFSSGGTDLFECLPCRATKGHEAIRSIAATGKAQK